MANRQKGEVAFDACGKSYVLCFSANALCELEDVIGVGVAKIGDLLSNPETLTLKNVRAVLWAGLTDHHSGIDLKVAGAIIDDVGMFRAVELIAAGLSAAFPDEDNASPQGPGQ